MGASQSAGGHGHDTTDAAATIEPHPRIAARFRHLLLLSQQALEFRATGTTATKPPNDEKKRHSAQTKEVVLDVLPKETFLQCFTAPSNSTFADRLLKAASKHSTTINIRVFHEVVSLAGAFGMPVENTLGFYFDLFSSDGEHLTAPDLRELFESSFVFAMASELHQTASVAPDDKEISALMQMINLSDGLSKPQFIELVLKRFHHVLNGLVAWVRLQGATQSADGAQSDQTTLPAAMLQRKQPIDLLIHAVPASESKEMPTVLNSKLAWGICSFLPRAFLRSGVWTCLYHSDAHGLSCNRIEHHSFRYQGPTIVLLKGSNGELFGAAVQAEWHESTQSFPAGEDSRVFSLFPEHRVSREPIKMYLNTKSRDCAHGLGFGSDPEHWAIWLTSTCSSATVDFSGLWPSGPLSASVSVQSMEIWGCGDPALTDAQQRERKRDDGFALQRQKAKHPDRWEDSPDFFLLKAAGVAVDHPRESLSS
eukprot:m.535075 g.535075  ORF g.535075 m.535075 type:complete len:481 (-) comp57610_c0_seq1:261-1703(-)